MILLMKWKVLLGILLGSAYAWFGIKLNTSAQNPGNPR